MVILGREGSGKTREVEKLRVKAKEIFGLNSVYLPAQFPISDWYVLNLPAKDLKGKKGVEKRELLLRACRDAVVVIDDAHRLTGQKLQVAKKALISAQYFVVSAPRWLDIPQSLRVEIERRQFREVYLKSDAAADISYILMALAVVVSFLTGFHEVAFLLMGLRYFMRQK
ncbi:hypothetical protein [Thermovibrio ammonificans]